jgi:SAM-dependent methyltransferase
VSVEKEWVFDIPWAREFARIRLAFIGKFLEAVRQQMHLASAADVGCGVGDFSNYLSDMGFRVVAVDGREENAKEAKRRYPGIEFLTENAEDLPLAKMGTFDLVLCFGLLYHLENPFRAIRNLQAITNGLLLIETMCVPSSHPTMDLLDEGFSENQSLNYVAFYPSESCLVKMLYRAGFPFVYLFKQLPKDELYTATLWRKRVRTILAASRIPLKVPHLVLAEEPKYASNPKCASNPWTTLLGKLRHIPIRLRSFLAKRLRERMDRLRLGRMGVRSK